MVKKIKSKYFNQNEILKKKLRGIESIGNLYAVKFMDNVLNRKDNVYGNF